MSKEAALPRASALPAWQRARWVCLALALLAFPWRLPHAARYPFGDGDETWFALWTAQRVAAGEWLFYIAGTDYGAPLQEALAALLFRVVGESPLALRLPVLLFTSAAVALIYLNLRLVAGRHAALALTLPLVFANSAIARYTTFALPCYAALLFLVAAVQRATFWLDATRTWQRWLAFGALLGFAAYTLKLTVIPAAVALGWLGLRSDFYARCRAVVSSVEEHRRFLHGGAALAAAVLAILPVLYRFLTRREVYAMSGWEMALVVLGGAFAVCGIVILAQLYDAPRRREWLPVLACLALLFLIPLPAKIWYARTQQAASGADRVALWTENRYSLKHAHEWPLQARLVVQGIFPAILLGRWDELIGPAVETESLEWESAVTFALFGILVVAGLQRWRSGRWRPHLREKDFVLIAPFLLTLAVMFPSWQLHSETSYRYLLPFLPGFFLLAFRCGEDHLRRHPRIAWAVLVLYLAYAWFDCQHHLFG